MGIRGLTAFLKEGSLGSISDHVDLSSNADGNHTESLKTEVASSSSRHDIVIDGNAFSHWFCLECFGTAPSLNTNYRMLKKHVTSWIIKCHTSNVNCFFVFDGATETDKLKCRLDRLCKQSANMNSALSQQPMDSRHDNLGDRDQKTPSNDAQSIQNRHEDSNSNSCGMRIQSTPPLLAISCIINAIRALQSSGTQQSKWTRAFYADGEADKNIVEVAIAINATAIMSNDSDMLIYETSNVGFIPFWGFGFANDGSLNAFIIKRRKLSNLMGISESNLPLLAALVGNDFTSMETCYHMHQILFEGFKTLKNRMRGESILTLDKLDLTNTADHDNLDETDGKRQKLCKSKCKRSDASMSAADRLKSRRRANKIEEENRRKASRMKHSDSSASISLSTIAPSCDLTVDVTVQNDSDAVSEIQSSKSKECSWVYGESGLKTVKAAAEFLHQLEKSRKILGFSTSLTAITVTSGLMGISEEEVISHIAVGTRCATAQDTTNSENQVQGLKKVPSLCCSFNAALEDSLERYCISSVNVNSNDALSSPPNLSHTTCRAEKRSRIRCCFRCCCCSPSCAQVQTGALSALLGGDRKDKGRRKDEEERKGQGERQGGREEEAEGAQSLHLDLRSEGRIEDSTSEHLHSSHHRRHLHPKGIRLSPDMDQVLTSKLFIGRTPCSLRIGVTGPSRILTPVRGEVTLPSDSRERQDESESERGAVAGVTDVTECRDTADYLLLQPLRARIYSCLFSVSGDGGSNSSSSSSNNTYIAEIFKKNASPHLEKRSFLISHDRDNALHALETLPAVSCTRERLMRSTACLLLGDRGPSLTLRVTNPMSLKLKLESLSYPHQIDYVRDQLFFLTMTAHLFLSIDLPVRTCVAAHVGQFDNVSSTAAAAAYVVSSFIVLLSTHRSCSLGHAELGHTHGHTNVDTKIDADNGEGEAALTVCDRIRESLLLIPSEAQEREQLSLTFINEWTRLQVCMQHVNFAVEVAARTTHIPSILNGDKSEKWNQEFKFLRLLCGGDVGLMDPTLFQITNGNLFTPLADLMFAMSKGLNVLSANKKLTAVLNCICKSLLPGDVVEMSTEILNDLVLTLVTSNQ